MRGGAAGPLGVPPSPASLSSVAVSLSPITAIIPTVFAPIPSVPQPYLVMSSLLHSTSLTFAASVAPQLITSLSSNSPPLFHSQASAMHPSPVVALLHPGLILSPACDPFPQELVQRVRAGQFVEMQDLLADNISLLSQLSSLQGVGTLPVPTVHHTRLHEVPSLVSWMYCFAAYVAIRTPDQLTREILVHA